MAIWKRLKKGSVDSKLSQRQGIGDALYVFRIFDFTYPDDWNTDETDE